MKTQEDLLRGSIYKSLETDDEFRTRIQKSGRSIYGMQGMQGSYLDDVVWTCFQMQRRLVEREVSPPSGPSSLHATR